MGRLVDPKWAGVEKCLSAVLEYCVPIDPAVGDGRALGERQWPAVQPLHTKYCDSVRGLILNGFATLYTRVPKTVRIAGRFDALILLDPGAAASANHVAPLPGHGCGTIGGFPGQTK